MIQNNRVLPFVMDRSYTKCKVDRMMPIGVMLRKLNVNGKTDNPRDDYILPKKIVG